MKSRIQPFFGIMIAMLSLLLATPGQLIAGAAQKDVAMPDFTKGDAIPEGANHDWNLGATGLRGWMYTNQMSTTDARQIYIIKVHEKSPAAGVLAVGDVILGVGGKRFSYDPRTEFGKALTEAESETGGGNLSLIRWRDGKTETVVLKLPVLGTYSATAPRTIARNQSVFSSGDAKY